MRVQQHQLLAVDPDEVEPPHRQDTVGLMAARPCRWSPA